MPAKDFPRAGRNVSYGVFGFQERKVPLRERPTPGQCNLPVPHFCLPGVHLLHELPYLVIGFSKCLARNCDALCNEKLPAVDLFLCELAVPAN